MLSLLFPLADTVTLYLKGIEASISHHKMYRQSCVTAIKFIIVMTSNDATMYQVVG